MSEKKITTMEMVLGEFGFCVVWEYLPHWADVTVYEIVGREGLESGSALYQLKGATTSRDTTEKVADAEAYLCGYIKWDGCTELDMGCPHWCGILGFSKHAALLKYLWERSGELLQNRDSMEPLKWSEYDAT